MIHELMLSIFERPIAFYPIFSRKTGSLTCGVLLSQLLHWNTAMKGESFYKTDAEIREETALSVDELKSAKSKLKGLDFVEISVKGIPAKTWYSFDLLKLAEWISANKIVEFPPTEKRETRQQDSDNSANSEVENPPTLHRIPKNTHKNTTKTGEPTPKKAIVKKEKVEFVIPEIEDVRAHFELKLREEKIQNAVAWSHCETDKFFAHYEKVNWRTGKVKMSSWKLAISGWVTRSVQNGIGRWVLPAKYQEFAEQKTNGYANRNTETANERITRVAGGAIELHNELLAKHGLL
jgi:hypothetical protein